jgi:hypothetical protein
LGPLAPSGRPDFTGDSAQRIPSLIAKLRRRCDGGGIGSVVSGGLPMLIV